MERLQPLLGAFVLSEWSNRAYEAVWNNPEFDWRRIDRQFPDPDRVDVALWVGKRLVGMALVRSDGDAVVLEFIEGDRSDDCPLRGSRTLIFLDVATNYAQVRGKQKLLVQPMNSGLVNHYEKLGFVRFPPYTGSPYMWKEV